MVIRNLPIAVALVQLGVFLCACNDSGTEAVHCLAGETQECHCPDGAMGVQECLPDNSGWNCCVCPSPCDDDDVLGPHDDDDTWPTYDESMDTEQSSFDGYCTIDVPLHHEYPSAIPEGRYDFYLLLVGWANTCWVEFWDLSSDYCEGYDSHGEPCESSGYSRPGWRMTNEEYGWDPVNGFWDYWILDLEYVMDLEQAHADGESIFPCEWFAWLFQTYWCCEEAYSGDTQCQAYWVLYEDYAAPSCVKGTLGSDR